MNRIKWQQLAEVRLREAEALLAAGLWDGAYYLAGYAVECGLKACIARLILAETFPDKDFAQKFYTHKLDELVVLAGLKDERKRSMAADPNLSDNWNTVAKWTEQARYVRTTEPDARSLYVAVADPTAGVLTWIKRYW